MGITYSFRTKVTNLLRNPKVYIVISRTGDPGYLRKQDRSVERWGLPTRHPDSQSCSLLNLS